MQVRIRVALTAAIVIVVAALPVEASCSNARIMRFGYILNPDAGYSYSESNLSSTISDRVQGSFWVIGDGNPADLQGNDNGSWQPVQLSPTTGSTYGGDAGWISGVYPGYPASSYSDLTTWASIGAQATDGCPDIANPAGNLCVAMVITDEVAGNGYFLLTTDAADAGGNYEFNGSAEMNLARIPTPTIVGAQFPPAPNTVQLSLVVPPLSEGLYVDPACNDAVSAYRYLVRLVDANSPPPVTRSIEDWPVDLTGPVAPGQVVNVVFDCPLDKHAYLATAIEFDSGFAAGKVSANSTRVECAGIFTEIEPRPRIRPGQELDLRDARGGKRGRER